MGVTSWEVLVPPFFSFAGQILVAEGGAILRYA
jgi:hypothetical protein